MREVRGLEHFDASLKAIGRFETNLNLLLFQNEARLRLEILTVGRLEHILSKYAKKSNPEILMFVTVRNVIDEICPSLQQNVCHGLVLFSKMTG